jgi:Kef-type K+ transport system membrane component KefB
LPGTAWLFVAVGLGVVLGVLIFATIRLPRSNAEFLAIVLGVIAFASGLASVLRLSPVVTCFFAGTLLTNFPNEQRDSVFRILNRLERPIHLVFLMIAGALWDIADWRGWVLVPLFVLCRIAGKWLGIVVSRFTLRSGLPVEFTQHRSLVQPMSMLAIALVVSIERFRDLGVSWVVTAVIGGAVVFELLVPARDDDSDPNPPALDATTPPAPEAKAPATPAANAPAATEDDRPPSPTPDEEAPR